MMPALQSNHSRTNFLISVMLEATMKISVVKLILLGIIVDIMVYFVVTPRLTGESGPSIQQFVIWEIIFTAVGLCMLYISSVKRKK